MVIIGPRGNSHQRSNTHIPAESREQVCSMYLGKSGVASSVASEEEALCRRNRIHSTQALS